MIRATSSLVFLDITVLDRKGRPVVKGLTKDDFIITEDKKPQTIFSFEPPEVHVGGTDAEAGSLGGTAPVTIFVLDLLNSRFENFAYIRSEVRRYLVAQPRQLKSPAELMVLGNRSLEMLQGYTRNRDDLVSALSHLRPALPYKMEAGFASERVAQSFDALQQIALQNEGLPGRKNIIWVGRGGPGINTASLPGDWVVKIRSYVHKIVNLLVNSRISLFVIYPGLNAKGAKIPLDAMQASMVAPGDDPFAYDISFGVFVNETGGELFYNRNDVDGEMAEAERVGGQYYTLTYQPPEGEENGKFRRVRVTLRDPDLRAVTKNGYYAPDKSQPVNPLGEKARTLVEAARSTIPMTALNVAVTRIVRHPDSRTADLTIQLIAKDLDWQPADKGQSTVELLRAAVSLNESRQILASRLETIELTAPTQDPERLDSVSTTLHFVLNLPRKTQSVRVAMETDDGRRIGTAEIDRQALAAAPTAPTPVPPPLEHRPDQNDDAHTAN
jgi:VWFA-related protein